MATLPVTLKRFNLATSINTIMLHEIHQIENKCIHAAIHTKQSN